MSGQLTASPENVAGVVGSSVTLRCAGSVLQWEEFATTPSSAKTISVEGRNYKDTMYDLITTPPGTYNLTIKSLDLTYGGKYQCKSITDESSYAFAEVIVFNGKTSSYFFYCLLDNI